MTEHNEQDPTVPSGITAGFLSTTVAEASSIGTPGPADLGDLDTTDDDADAPLPDALRLGDQGEWVGVLHDELARIYPGLDSIPAVDGGDRYGAMTARAVRSALIAVGRHGRSGDYLTLAELDLIEAIPTPPPAESEPEEADSDD